MLCKFLFHWLAEEQEKPADLSQRVVFKKPKKAAKPEDEEEAAVVESTDSQKKDSTDKKLKDSKPGVSSGKSKTSSANKSTGKLSFAQDEEEDF